MSKLILESAKEVPKLKVYFSWSFSIQKSIVIWTLTNKKAAFWNCDISLLTNCSEKKILVIFCYSSSFPVGMLSEKQMAAAELQFQRNSVRTRTFWTKKALVSPLWAICGEKNLTLSFKSCRKCWTLFFVWWHNGAKIYLKYNFQNYAKAFPQNMQGQFL